MSKRNINLKSNWSKYDKIRITTLISMWIAIVCTLSRTCGSDIHGHGVHIIIATIVCLLFRLLYLLLEPKY